MEKYHLRERGLVVILEMDRSPKYFQLEVTDIKRLYLQNKYILYYTLSFSCGFANSIR